MVGIALIGIAQPAAIHGIIKKSSVPENFWIGIRLPTDIVRLDEVQGDLADKFKSITGQKEKFRKVQFPHITIAQGTVADQAAKDRLKKALKSINWKKELIRFYDGGNIFGKPERFIVLELDEKKSKHLVDLANRVRTVLKGQKGISLKMANKPIKLHVSLGTMYPHFAQLSPVQKRKVDKIVDDLDVHNIKRYPRAATTLKNFKVNEFKLVVTPKAVRLSPKQLVSKQYVYGTFKAQ